MSDSLAIAAVTAALRNLLFSGLNQDVSGTTVTTRPPDTARAGNTGNQVNLFLYHLAADTAWSNMDIPWRNRPGESPAPHLPLRLYYLLTAYFGEYEDHIDSADAGRLMGSQRLLGHAISILLDHSVLDTSAIQAGLPPQDQLEHPFDSLENVRIVFQPLSLDEMSKLWSGFQTHYRLSAAFEVSMVLIESGRSSRTPLPVLSIGTNNAGVRIQTDLHPPRPALTSVTPSRSQPCARLNEALALEGRRLTADEVRLQFSHRLWESPRILVPSSSTDTRIRVQLPDLPVEWPAGVYAVNAVLTTAGGPVVATNALPFLLAPEIVDVTPDPAVRESDHSVPLTVTCRPQVRPGQSISLLMGDRQATARTVASQTDVLAFSVADAVPGDHFLRLRVDGVDSLLVDHSTSPPVFDPTQKVTIAS